MIDLVILWSWLDNWPAHIVRKMETIDNDLTTQWPNWELKMVGYPGATVLLAMIVLLSMCGSGHYLGWLEGVT
jgi:hypothetical protein